MKHLDTTSEPIQINLLCKGSMIEHLGIEITELGDKLVCGKMPVDHRTIQPMGLLHGGASVALAETLGSLAGMRELDSEKQYCVGLEINANHIKSVKEGYVYGKATPIHIGKRTQVWEIRITNDKDKCVCVSRITLAVVNKTGK
ncbi:MAG: thioesterase [Gammaproteobacteria bacterium]|nr:MAG: thioesterase [Gammaproteobacteria bacterium]